MSFIPNTEEPLTPITNDGFFPEIDPAKFPKHVRIDDAINDDQRRSALIVGISHANCALRLHKATLIEAGYETLSAVPAEQIDGLSVHIFDYFEAVFCHAKSVILRSYQDTDTTVVASNTAEKKSEAWPAFDARVFDALQRITDGTHTQVELI